SEFMVSWATSPSRLFGAGRVVAATLVGAMLVSAIFSIVSQNPLPLLSVLFVEALLGLYYRSRVLEFLQTINEAVRELQILGSALERMEHESFSSRRLHELQSNLRQAGKKPSEEIARLVKMRDYLNQRRNEFFAIISFVLLWATQFAFAMEAWRQRNGSQVESWLRNFGEFEALCALAGYAYEHPGDPFPEIVEGETIFEGEKLGHPLIDAKACVPNSV